MIPTYTYRVVLTLTGPTTSLAYDVLSTDAPDYGPIDPLTMGWTYPNGADLTPTQYEPPTAEFGIVLPDIADLGDIAIGSTVDLELYIGPGAANLAGELHGRITDLRAAPYFRTVGGVTIAGVAIGITAVDYLADLGEDDDQGESGFVAGNLRTRIVDLLTPRAGEVNSPSVAPSVPVPLQTINVDAYPSSNDSTLALVSRFLDEFPLVLTPGYWGNLDEWIKHEGFCHAVLTYDGAQAVVVPIRKNYTADRYPGILAADGTVSWDADGPAGRCWVADACADVAGGVTYTRTKRGYPNRWVSKSTTTPTAKGSAATGEVPYVTVVRETELDGAVLADLHAQAMRPSMVDSGAWESSPFTFLLHDASPLADPGSPLMVTPATVEETLTGVVVIHGIPPTQSPVTHGGDVYAGRLLGATLRVAGGVVTCEAAIRPEYPRGDGGIYGVSDHAVTLTGLRNDLPALTVDDVDPAVTVNLCRLVRQTN